MTRAIYKILSSMYDELLYPRHHPHVAKTQRKHYLEFRRKMKFYKFAKISLGSVLFVLVWVSLKPLS